METDPPSEPPDPGATPSRKRQADDGTVSSSSKKSLSDPSQANPSIGNLYIHPSFAEGLKSYANDDKGPFVVQVSRDVEDPTSGASLRAITFGQFLHKHKISSILHDGVKNVGRNKIIVEFSTAHAANHFLVNPILSLCKFKAFIPTYNMTRMGLVKGVPIDWSMSELVQSLELPPGCGEVLKARRLNRKTTQENVTTWIPTQSVVLTFRGQILPSKVYSYHTSLPIETYKLPTIQCLNCCRFGHTKTICRSQPRCYRCSQSHAGESCEIDKNLASCLHCSGKHFANDKACPEFTRQQSIKVIMSQNNISYMEAAAQFPSVRRSYAEMAKEMFTPPAYSPKTPSCPTTQPTPKTSYRQTTFRSPRPRAPPGKGYDRGAHQNIVGECASSLPNGHALNQNSPPNETLPMLEQLSTLLLSLITPCSDIPLPSNVAKNISKLFKILQDGPNNHTSMEQ
ncbi:uncharacterized protein LOC123723044 [Papilio machaon]|uniref:uncharacterized protein LOC123723044 n=1 Tax=Papilio machaon TaxID=76193 RepID=UPI001E664878|nr:uncharacterized protein LOC123723044 [Papilio machaon]